MNSNYSFVYLTSHCSLSVLGTVATKLFDTVHCEDFKLVYYYYNNNYDSDHSCTWSMLVTVRIDGLEELKPQGREGDLQSHHNHRGFIIIIFHSLNQLNNIKR